ncbi:6-phosphogluconolactonase [Microbacterium sp. ASV49]|uniref:6-phosphogluconolactonase n=1 Tax=Microbacterium candidum TaxID=3041922 RepID=A0ABT7MU09_9MICO|nr:6-phosphogluconolactonase [Microbacterium sp. ASV49]MDL9977931.1 6-phosphogluconolactonase [Microbacterium sp. ASV49]
MTSTTRILPDAEAVGREVAGTIADRMEAALAAGRRFILGCPGGRTPQTTYAALAAEAAERGLDLRTVVIAMMDDYVVPAGDGWMPVDADAHNSCRRFAREEIQAVLNAAVGTDRAIPDENVWFPDVADPAAYDARLRDAGGIDFFILASGASDGHVAFNPAGSARDSRSRITPLAEATRTDNIATFPDFAGLDAVPTHGITMGIATIAELSAEGAMIVLGADKQLAFERLSAGDDYDESWPATVYHLIPGATLYADASAAGSSA